MKLKFGLIAFIGAGVVGCGDDDSQSTASGSTGSTGSTGTTDEASTAATEVEATDSGASSTTQSLPEVDFEADIQPVINANCTCHLAGPSGMMTAMTLNMNPGNAYANLVGVASTQAPLSIIEPGSLEDSYLWRKVNDTHEAAGGSGTPMPPAGNLDAEELTLLEAWIASGAES